MNEFIPTIRTDRRREMLNYESKKYRVEDKTKYIFLGDIVVNYNDNELKYKVRVDGHEIYFYITKGDGYVFFSIYQIYEYLLKLIEDQEGFNPIEILYGYLETVNEMSFIYNGLDYSIKELMSALPIEIAKLITLIFLIQGKSNYFFQQSKTQEKKKYTDGLVRLLIVLLSKKEDDLSLRNRGWIYSKTSDRFELSEVDVNKDKKEFKYYLTQEEMSNII